jgi:hypothetical protein
MTAKARPPSPSKSRKAPALQPHSETDDPLATNCVDVTVKLKNALKMAKSGITEGAVIIALDRQGYWSVDRAGKLVDDEDTLFLIAGRMFGACLMK